MTSLSEEQEGRLVEVFMGVLARELTEAEDSTLAREQFPRFEFRPSDSGAELVFVWNGAVHSTVEFDGTLDAAVRIVHELAEVVAYNLGADYWISDVDRFAIGNDDDA